MSRDGTPAGGGEARSFPPALEAALVEGARWYRERVSLEKTIAASAGAIGSAQRNQEDRDNSDRTGGSILMEIMEEIEDAWGFGRDV